ncbi:MAG: DUF2779 domain-containing protein [Acidobacteriota bacterium]|nr:DUF2779 domain-containing protein [Acidobacteriota bacterium]
MKNTVNKADWLAAGRCQAMAWSGLRVESLPADEATRFRMEQGQEVGVCARELYPNGVLVVGTAKASVAEVTQGLVTDRSAHTLFEAAFEIGPFAARADILSREGSAWHLLEVKSSFSDSTSIKEYVDDLAYTAMVLRRAGLAVVKTSLVLLSRDYRHGMGVDSLFTVVDQTEAAEPRAAEFERIADAVASALLGEVRPASVMVSACRGCDYFSSECLGAGHEHTVLELPNLHHTKLKKLSADGIISLSHMPADFALSDRQRRVMDAALSGQIFVADGLGATLQSILWPCHYLDFETVATVMPLYEGHGCHQQVLTQFSVHHRDAPDADPRHSEFLANARQSEERQLAEALIEVLGQKGSIIVYGSFEKTRISALRDVFADLGEDLDALLGRLVDLCEVIASNVYHPEFKGSFSIKQVVPALVPDLSYAGLAVADGNTAIAKFARMARGEIPSDAIALTRAQLLAYCRLDTLGMVRLHEVLCRLAP